ncbi:MAG TPA: hypothetical protein VNQ90_01990 [Chthoniobacteraceae bacterium]|nr:hypothetical protein [Chthoniobacteraceae bacterium]
MNKPPVAHYRSEPQPGVPVLHVAPEGSDTATGEATHPLKTVSAAIGRLAGGGVIRLAPGVYHERITVTTRATPVAPLIIEGALSAEGRRLSTVDGSTPLDPASWKPRPDLGPGVYACPIADPHLLLVNHLSVARLHWDIDFKGNNKKEHYLASEVLAWPPDHRITTHYREESIPFWETIGGVYSPGKDLKEVYLRLYRERDPRKELTAVSLAGPVISLHGSQYVQLRDLAICGGEYGVEIGGEGTAHNTVENCFIIHGRKRILVNAGASGTVLKGNQIRIGFIGQKPGTWSGQNPAAARKEFVYLYFKYWASPRGFSDDVSIEVEKESRGTLIEGNRLEGGLIGVGLSGGDEVTVRGNTIRHFSSVGTVIRAGGDVAVYDGNLFEDCNISIRPHNLNGPGPQRHLWFLRNVSIRKPDAGSHIYCHVSPGTHPYPDHQVIFAQNTFIGGHLGIFLPRSLQGTQGFQMINNRFIGCSRAISGTVSYFKQHSMFGYFDYNQIIGGEIGRHGVPVWYGQHNLDDTKAAGWRVGENSVRLPTPDRGRGAGLDLSRPYEVDGKSFPALSELMPGYGSGPMPPDLGAPAPLPPAIGKIYDN